MDRKPSTLRFAFTCLATLALGGCFAPGLPDLEETETVRTAVQTADSFRFPLDNYPVNDGCRNFGWYGDWDGNGTSEYHLADDACAPAGTDVYAVANGEVKWAGSYYSCPDWIGLIVIEHELPSGRKVVSIYGHALPVPGIHGGAEVTKGQLIGELVSYCYGDHIHFGIYDGPFEQIYCGGPGNCYVRGYAPYLGNYVDPIQFVQQHEDLCSTEYRPVKAVEVDADGADYDIYSFFQRTPGAELDLYGNVAADTGNTSTNKAFLEGDVTGDGVADLISVTIDSNPTTRVYVREGVGDGGFHPSVLWKTRTGKRERQRFVEDVNDDGVADLILGRKRTVDDKMLWVTCLSTGSTFDTCQSWATDQVDDTFGKYTDTWAPAGDVNGNGKATLLRGREQTSGDCAGRLKWKQLKHNGTSEVITDTCWGYPASQYLTEDVDLDGKQELVQIRTTSDTVGVFVGHYNTATDELDTGPWATDVGGVAGWYRLADVSGDDVPDMIRWNEDGAIKWMRNLGGAFQEQGQQSVLYGYRERSEDDYLLFAYFGDRPEQVCIDGDGWAQAMGLGEEDLTVDGDGDGWTPVAGDCDDDDPAVSPSSPEIPGNGVDDNCDGYADDDDFDMDGWWWLAGDCDDQDPDVNPGATEVPGNGIDDDCDGHIDAFDADGDGFYDTEGDCDDSDPAVHPAAAELPGNGVDDNCDGLVDDNDYDQDGFYWSDGDCDDEDPAVHPWSFEVAGNGVDDDCDGFVDQGDGVDCYRRGELVADEAWIGYRYVDAPGLIELWSLPAASPWVGCHVENCLVVEVGSLFAVPCDTQAYAYCWYWIEGTCVEGPGDFDDADGDGFTPADGDCDDTDPGLNPADDDGDGVSTCDGDCDDMLASVHPGATEICDDGYDNDCDGDSDAGDTDCPEEEVPGDDDAGDDDTGDDDAGDDDAGDDDAGDDDMGDDDAGDDDTDDDNVADDDSGDDDTADDDTGDDDVADDDGGDDDSADDDAEDDDGSSGDELVFNGDVSCVYVADHAGQLAAGPDSYSGLVLVAILAAALRRGLRVR